MLEQPNILMIMTDQHKFNALSCKSGPEGLSPNLDKLAENAVVFDNAYTPSPVCAPARAAIKTGMYPPGCGVVQNWLEFKPETDDFMPQRLKNCGYQTGLVGKLHFVPVDRDYGFEYKMLHDAPYSVYADDDKNSEYIKWLKEDYFDKKGVDPVKLFDEDENSYDTDIRRFIAGEDFRTEEEHDIPWTYNRSSEFIKNRDKDKPFFLFASFFGPHQPYMTPSPWRDKFSYKDIELPENFEATMENSPIFNIKNKPLSDRLRKTFTPDDYRKLIALNYGQIAMLDHYIGMLLDDVKNEGIWDNTVVIFVSDHGDHLGSYGLFFKGEMYDSCCKVPLMIKPAKAFEPAQRQQNVNTLDLYGTVLDYAGDTDWKKDGIESRSLCELVDTDNAEWDNSTYSIIGADADKALTMLKEDNLKLIRLADGENAYYELYDLEKDKNECHNVYEELKDSAKVEAMKEKLDSWYLAQANKYPTERKLHDKKG